MVRCDAGVPKAFVGVYEVVTGVDVLVEASGFEDEELGLRAPVTGVGDAARLEVGLGLVGDVARVAAVGLASYRVEDIANHVEGGDLEERVDSSGAGIGDQQHVAFVDGLETADAGAVEAVPFGHVVLAELAQGDGEVLKRARQVGEPQVNDADVVGLTKLDDFSRGHTGFLLWDHFCAG